MIIRKEITIDNEFCLWFNGELIYKKWLNHGYSKVFDRAAWDKYTSYSITDFDLEQSQPFFEVVSKLYLIPSNKGGRQTPISSGYRPDHVFEHEEDGTFKYAFMGEIQLDVLDIIKPGQEAKVTVRFLTHQPIEQYLQVGKKWWLYEGRVKVGEAEIISMNLINLGD